MTELQGHIYKIEEKILKIIEQKTCVLINQLMEDLKIQINNKIGEVYKKEMMNIMTESYLENLKPDKYKDAIRDAMFDSVLKNQEEIMRKKQKENKKAIKRR